MKIRNEWMKNNELFGEDYSKDLLLKQEQVFFEQRMINESKPHLVDGIQYNLIIHQSSNPLNEFKEERKVICALTVPVHRGSIIENLTTHEKYLVTADVDTNSVYLTTKMQKCNYTLKWQDAQANIHEYPCIEGDLSLYTDGTQQIQKINTVDTKVSIQITNDSITKSIVRNQRFIVSRQTYEVTRVEDASKPGILIITMTEVGERVGLDNFETGIADNSHLYIPKLVPTTTTILGSDTVKIGQQQSYTVNDTVNKYMWFTTNGNVTILSQGNNKCAIKGNVLGTVTLRAICAPMTPIEKTITITALF